jgi:hypothetical protein
MAQPLLTPFRTYDPVDEVYWHTYAGQAAPGGAGGTIRTCGECEFHRASVEDTVPGPWDPHADCPCQVFRA